MRIDGYKPARWLISAGLAAVAAWLLTAGLVAAGRSRSGWATVISISVFALAFAALFAWAAYLCFKHRYRDLFMVGAAVVAFLLLSLCLEVLHQLGVYDAILNKYDAMHNRTDPALWQTLVVFALSLLLLLGPFYVAGWLLRLCSHFATRRLPNGPAVVDT